MTDKVRAALIVAALAMGLFSNSSAAQTLEDFGAKLATSQQHCTELKQDTAKIKQAAQNPNISPQQKKDAEDAVAAIDRVVATIEKTLGDPALKTNPDRLEATLTRAQSAIVNANGLASLTESHLGIPRSGPTDRVVAATAKITSMLESINRDDFTMKVSNGFNQTGFNSNDVSVQNVGTGNRFFGLGGDSSAPAVNANYAPTTAQAAEQQTQKYGGVLGGIMLEDTAAGLGRIATVNYDGRYNALLMDGHLVYFMKVPSWEAAALCRDISQDELMRVGVSMGKANLVYGKRSTYENTSVGYNLLMTDEFLGDFVFGWQKWSKGYKFPNGYKPRTTDIKVDMLVQFAFRSFQFAAKGNEVRLANVDVDVRFMPVSKATAPDGGMLPDMEALKRGYDPPPEFLSNAHYLTSHFDFFRRERIVAETIAYGELAALFRTFKQSSVNLESLASAMERE